MIFSPVGSEYSNLSNCLVPNGLSCFVDCDNSTSDVFLLFIELLSDRRDTKLDVESWQTLLPVIAVPNNIIEARRIDVLIRMTIVVSRRETERHDANKSMNGIVSRLIMIQTHPNHNQSQ